MRRRRARFPETGAAATEAVLLTPVLLLVVLVVVQFGLWYHAGQVVRAAASEGARTARVEASTAEAGRVRAVEFLAATGPSIVRDPVVTATVDGERATVRVTGRAAHIIPGLSMPVRATAVSVVERFREDAP